MNSPVKQSLLNIFAGKFWFNGKGILVPVLYSIALFLVAGIAVYIKPYQLIPDKGPVANAFFGGMILLIGGLATWFVGKDFIKKDGVRMETDLNNQFLFFKMKTFGQISFVGGFIVLCYAAYLSIV